MELLQLQVLQGQYLVQSSATSCIVFSSFFMRTSFLHTLMAGTVSVPAGRISVCRDKLPDRIYRDSVIGINPVSYGRRDERVTLYKDLECIRS